MEGIMRTAAIIAAIIAAVPLLARADKPGDHPAVVVQRLHAQQGYDYLSKYYPHPAWLFLLAEPPREMGDHPAVLVWRREQLRSKTLALREPSEPIHQR
jgi:hypothetical protein